MEEHLCQPYGQALCNFSYLHAPLLADFQYRSDQNRIHYFGSYGNDQRSDYLDSAVYRHSAGKQAAQGAKGCGTGMMKLWREG